MATNSTHIAKLLGPALVALAITEGINLHVFQDIPAAVVYLNGALLFIAGVAILRVHNVWTTEWPVLVTLTGWFSVLLGITRMTVPARSHTTDARVYLVLIALLAVGFFLSVKAYSGTEQGHFKKTAVAVCVVLAAAAAWASVQYRSEISRQWKRVSTDSQIAETPCGPIEYAIAGSGTPLLVVHGAGGGFDQGLDFTQGLAQRNIKVIAVSRFGYLRTPLPDDASATTQADAHLCLLNALGISRAAIAGASAGAPSAMQFAIRHPDQTAALFLLVPAAYRPDPNASESTHVRSMTTPAWTEFLFNTALKSDLLFWLTIRMAPDITIGSILATPPEVVRTADRSEQQRVQQVMVHLLPITPRRLGLINDAKVTSTLPRYDLEHIHAPTLIVSLKDDGYGTYPGARYSADHIPGARFIGYERGGHVWVGHNQEILEEAAQFVHEHQ